MNYRLYRQTVVPCVRHLAWGIALLAMCPPIKGQAVYTPYTFNTLAGVYGSENGPGSAVRLYNPLGAATDASGNVYLSDLSYRILKITPDGLVFTLAGNPGVQGSADGTGPDATFTYPRCLAVDGGGNVYVADDEIIRKITPIGVVTSIAGAQGIQGSTDGTGAAARFNIPSAIAVDQSGNVYVADSSNDTIRKVTQGGVVATLAGTAGVRGSADGTGASAQFFYPAGITVDQNGVLYVADVMNATIRKITPAGLVTTLAGSAGIGGTVDGTGAAAQLSPLGPLTIDSSGNLYFADFGVNGANVIRKVTPSGKVTTLFGGTLHSSVGSGAAGTFVETGNLAVDQENDLYVVDSGNNLLWKISPAGSVSGFVGDRDGFGNTDGTGAVARFSSPSGAALDQYGNLFVADSRNNVIRKITPGGVTTTFAGMDSNQGGSSDGPGASAQFNFPTGVAVDKSGNVYVADTGNSTIRKITSSGIVSTFAGSAGAIGSADGASAAALFNSPEGVAVDQNGYVYIADSENFTIRKITPEGAVTTLAGTAGQLGSADGTGSAAQFVLPDSLAVDAEGNIYVADWATSAGRNVYANDTIRRITPEGIVTTLAGAPSATTSIVGIPSSPNPGQSSSDGVGSAARFGGPRGIAVDIESNVYVADAGSDTIRKVTKEGVVTTLAGSAGLAGCQDGIGPMVRFNSPVGIAVDGSGNVYVVDSGNNTIRVGTYNAETTVPTEPTLSSIPTFRTISNGTTVVFRSPTANSPSPSYQWYFNGAAIAGATKQTLLLNDATAANAGYFDCIATNALGISTSTTTLNVVDASDPGRLINLSCRSLVGTGASVLTTGFVVGGNGTSGSETLLIRASGPALVPFDIAGVLPDPDLTLINFDSNSILGTNVGWGGSTLVSATANAVGAFAWTNTSSPDSALVATLPTGPYLAQLTGAIGDSGIALAEVYDATPEGGYSRATPRLINISARTQVGQGGNILIAGFVIGGSTSETVLIRASGPALTPFGVSHVLPDPQLQLYQSTNLIATNTGWGGDTQVAATAASVGAFSWGSSTTPDSAILITLVPGAYTAQVSGASGDSGDALIEVYEVE